MSDIKNNNETIWKDRKHWMWFPFSFTSYELKKERLYEKTGFFKTDYDELLLYRIMDIKLSRTLGQKIFGTGTITLKCKADSRSEHYLVNIKNPMDVKEMFSQMVEDARRNNRVVGKEFYGDENYYNEPDGDDGDNDYDDFNDDNED